MRAFHCVLPVVVAAVLGNLAQASDTTITLQSEGQDVVGTLSLPDGDAAPVVLLLHGFTGARDELKTDHVPEGVFGRTSQRLLESGFASLRIDFRGSGESLNDLSFAETTFEGQVADALAAIEYLQKSDKVQGDELHVVGWSQGGLVASAAANRSDALDALALWAAVGDTQQTFSGILGEDIMKVGMAAEPDETTKVTLPWGAEIELNGAFFDGMDSFDPIAEIKGYTGPLFVAQGSKDETVLPATAEKFVSAHEGPEQLWLADMDHVFNTFATDETLEQLVSTTIEFFEKHDD